MEIKEGKILRKYKLTILLLFLSVSVFAQVYSVPLKKLEGDLFELNIEINGVVKVPGLLDTGASSVTLPPSVVRVLILNNTLTVKDTLQGNYYMYANGQVAYCKRFLARKIKIGEVTLKNVPITISNTENSPILFGQSILKRFKRYAISNKTKTLYFRLR